MATSVSAAKAGLLLPTVVENHILPAIEVSRNFRTLRDMEGSDRIINMDSLEYKRELGMGAFGQVFLCDYKSGDKTREVAVKQLRHRFAEKTTSSHLLAEATLLKKLSHSCIVEFIGVGMHCEEPKADQCLYIVTEFCVGGSLTDLLSKQVGGMRDAGIPHFCGREYVTPTEYSYSTAVSWLLDVAMALKFLHSASPMVIHRDVKSDNVLLQMNPSKGRLSAKLADFGLCSIPDVKLTAVRRTLSGEERDMKERGAKAKRLRSFGRVQYFEDEDESFELTGKAGTLFYMAPEVMNGSKYNEQCDIYSLGVLAHELMTGKPRMSNYQVVNSGAMKAHMHATMEGARPRIPAHLPEEVIDFISACWEQSPADRPTAGEAAAKLTDLQTIVKDWELSKRKLSCCWGY